MSDCCDPRGYPDIFGSRFVRKVARKYRKRGLDDAASTMVDFLAEGDLTGRTVLEIGGGVGEIGVELLRRGAASVTTLELSPTYDEEARRVAEEAGVADRVHRRIVDVAAKPDEVEPADLVVMHRVVCCYPDYERLLGAAADRCRSRLAFSHPPRDWVSRALFGGENALYAITRKEFRVFVHRPELMVRTVESRGLRPVPLKSGRIWKVEGLAR
jgi:magnesium-protoporphyrin O-methyltransferase